jgi:hypothetical protein
MAKRTRETALHQSAQLTARLSDYSAITRVSAAAQNLHRRAGNWPIYAAAAGSAMAMATNASASIITCASNCTVSAPSTFGSDPGFIQLLGTAATNKRFLFAAVLGQQTYGGSPFTFGSVNARAGANVKLFFTGSVGNPHARNFKPGSAIGPNATGNLGSHGIIEQKALSTSGFGNFTAGVDGYVGVQVQGNEYGWIKLVFTVGGESKIPSALTVISWDLDLTPNQAIGAGLEATTPTPEPGTMALGLLAAGAAGVTALRRRRLSPPSE